MLNYYLLIYLKGKNNATTWHGYIPTESQKNLLERIESQVI